MEKFQHFKITPEYDFGEDYEEYGIQKKKDENLLNRYSKEFPAKAFFIAIRWEQNEKINNIQLLELKDYFKKLYVNKKIGHTIISYEIAEGHKETDGQHVHVFTHMLEKTYHTLAQCLIKNKWKLRGRSIKDKPKQYGKLTEIRDRDKMVAYTIKGGNIESTYSEEYLLPFYKMSYVKVDKYQDMKARVLLHFKDTLPTIEDVACFVIDYHREKGYKRPNLSYIKNIYTDYQYDYKPNGQYHYDSKFIWEIMNLR